MDSAEILARIYENNPRDPDSVMQLMMLAADPSGRMVKESSARMYTSRLPAPSSCGVTAATAQQQVRHKHRTLLFMIHLDCNVFPTI